jgi:hypothetical protein
MDNRVTYEMLSYYGVSVGNYMIKLYNPDYYEIITDSNASEFSVSGNKKLAALAIVKYVEKQCLN